MAIDRIFQRFDLDLEAFGKMFGLESITNLGELCEEGKQKLKELNFPQSTETLRQKLLEKGYEVLESNDIYCGLHGSIIIGGEFGKSHKGDFYELTAQFNLPYRSGHSYFEAKLEHLAQSKKSEMPNPVKGLSLSLFPIKNSH